MIGPAQLPAGTAPDVFTPAPDALGLYNCDWSGYAVYNGSELAQQMPCMRDGNKYIVCIKGDVRSVCQHYSDGKIPAAACTIQCYTLT